MSIVLDAVYEKGVFRPLKQVHFKESQPLKIIVSDTRPEIDMLQGEVELLSSEEVWSILGVTPDASVTHKQIEKELASIRGTMAEACREERDERW